MHRQLFKMDSIIFIGINAHAESKKER